MLSTGTNIIVEMCNCTQLYVEIFYWDEKNKGCTDEGMKGWNMWDEKTWVVWDENIWDEIFGMKTFVVHFLPGWRDEILGWNLLLFTFCGMKNIAIFLLFTFSRMKNFLIATPYKDYTERPQNTLYCPNLTAPAAIDPVS